MGNTLKHMGFIHVCCCVFCFLFSFVVVLVCVLVLVLVGWMNRRHVLPLN